MDEELDEGTDYANNYFDVGLRALEEITSNKRPAAFVACEQVYAQTRKKMIQACAELLKVKPEAKTVVESFINDGQTLFSARNRMSERAYREIDSGISAVLIYGAIGGENFLKQHQIRNSPCRDKEDLKEKYALFQISEIINIDELPDNYKRIVGQQAIEMIFACLDDLWGNAEDQLLGTPSLTGDENKILLQKYRHIALECGNPSLIVNLANYLFYLHRLKKNKVKIAPSVELSKVGQYHNLADIFLLREWLFANSLLSSMFAC